MSRCRDCRFWEKNKDDYKPGVCRHPYYNGAKADYYEECILSRSTKWKGCLVAFPKGIAIAFVYLLDLIVYFVFGKTLYKRTQGKDKTND